MSTIDKKLADELITRDGRYMNDPQIMRIVKYTNAWGGEAYGMEYEQSLGRYADSEFINKPSVYWAHSSCPAAFLTIQEK